MPIIINSTANRRKSKKLKFGRGFNNWRRRSEMPWRRDPQRGTMVRRIPKRNHSPTIIRQNNCHQQYLPTRPYPKIHFENRQQITHSYHSEFQQSHEFWNHQKRSSLQLSQLHKVDSQSTIKYWRINIHHQKSLFFTWENSAQSITSTNKTWIILRLLLTTHRMIISLQTVIPKPNIRRRESLIWTSYWSRCWELSSPKNSKQSKKSH